MSRRRFHYFPGGLEQWSTLAVRCVMQLDWLLEGKIDARYDHVLKRLAADGESVTARAEASLGTPDTEAAPKAGAGGCYQT